MSPHAILLNELAMSDELCNIEGIRDPLQLLLRSSCWLTPHTKKAPEFNDLNFMLWNDLRDRIWDTWGFEL